MPLGHTLIIYFEKFFKKKMKKVVKIFYYINHNVSFFKYKKVIKKFIYYIIVKLVCKTSIIKLVVLLELSFWLTSKFVNTNFFFHFSFIYFVIIKYIRYNEISIIILGTLINFWTNLPFLNFEKKRRRKTCHCLR